MLGVGNQRVAVEPVGEEFLAEGNGSLRVHIVDARPAPIFFGRLDDEGGPILVEAVGVQIEPAPLSLLEIERECVELLSAAKPDEAIFAHLDVGLEEFFKASCG